MKKQLFLTAIISLVVLIVAFWKLDTVRSQDVSGISTNTFTAPSADADSDSDGFTDAQEVAWGTDPHNADSHPDLVTGMVAWLPLDEGSGTQALDASGQGHNGTMVGSQLPTWTSDSSGSSLAFDGTLGRVAITNSSELTPTSVFTMMAWVAVNNGVQGTVLNKKSADATQNGYSLSVTDGRLSALLRVAGVDRPLYGHASITDGQWHHIACTYDGFEFCLFVDGVRDVATRTGGTVNDTDGPLNIGQIAGHIRDVGIYQRAFDVGEIKLLYQTVSTTGVQMARRQPTIPSFLYAHLKATAPVQASLTVLRKGVTP